jgi:Tol biopolymer transport system component
MPDRDPNLLESWKEIAAFLGRDKRTAMRWSEDYGMPVRRYPGVKQARVFAYRRELVAWLESFAHLELGPVPRNVPDTTSHAQGSHGHVQGSVTGAAIQDSDPPGQGTLESRYSLVSSHSPQDVPGGTPLNREDRDTKGTHPILTLRHRNRLIARALGVFVLVVAVAAVLRLGTKSAAGSKAAGLIQLTDDGRMKEYLRTDGTTLFFDELVGRNRMLASTPIEGGPVHPIPAPFANVALVDVSPDGKSLLVLNSEQFDSPEQLWKLPAQGGTPTPVGKVRCFTARWSSDGTKIAFSAGNGLYITDGEGQEPHLIASFEARPRDLIWSPDGRQVRFVVENRITHAPTAWEIDSRGTGSFSGRVATKLALQSPCCEHWTWIGDSSDFAYVVRQEVGSAHSVIRNQRFFRSGWFGTQKELTFNADGIESLTSGTHGSRIYFLLSNALRGELLRFNPSENAFQSFLPGLSGRYLAFSRDGQWMTYTLTQDSSLWRSRADGTQALQIMGPPMEVQLSSWSPDGSQIAFMGRMPGSPWRIYLAGRDGGSPREATSGDDNQGAPTWSPDGKTISYGRVYCEAGNSCGIFLLDLETGRSQPLPGSEKLHTARWSPDGKYIAALQRDTQRVQLFDLKDRRWHNLAENVAGNDLSWSKNSKTLYVSCLVHAKPSIDKVRISDRSRSVAVDLSPLQKMPGQLGMWFGLSPGDSPIVLHLYTSSEVYALDSRDP